MIPGDSWLVPGRILVDSWSIWHNCCCCLDTRIPTSPTRIMVDSWWKEFLVIPGIPGRNDKESGRNLAGMKIMELVRFCQFGWVPSPGHSCQDPGRFLADSWSFLPGMPGMTRNSFYQESPRILVGMVGILVSRQQQQLCHIDHQESTRILPGTSQESPGITLADRAGCLLIYAKK